MLVVCRGRGLGEGFGGFLVGQVREHKGSQVSESDEADDGSWQIHGGSGAERMFTFTPGSRENLRRAGGLLSKHLAMHHCRQRKL